MANAPAIVKLSETVLVEIERAVRGFARYHKYSIGAELRTHGRAVARAAQRAWRGIEERERLLEALAESIDEVKLSLQIGQRLQAFASFAQFEALARLVNDLGRQCGGWQKQQRGQNRRRISGGRAERLSARDASSEAKP